LIIAAGLILPMRYRNSFPDGNQWSFPSEERISLAESQNVLTLARHTQVNRIPVELRAFPTRDPDVKPSRRRVQEGGLFLFGNGANHVC
jgi:hypothetical protein